jgi:hypothetical protein
LILYGDLKRKIRSIKTKPGRPAKLKLIKDENLTSVRDILKKFDLKDTDISHIFVNGKYCGPGKNLTKGDRIGIFPRNMGLIFAEIEKNHPISVTVQFKKGLKNFRKPSEFMIRIPKGGNINYLLERLNLLKIEDIEILVNEKKILDNETILKDQDRVQFIDSKTDT